MQINLTIRREINLDQVIRSICRDRNKCEVTTSEIYEYINKQGFNVNQRVREKIMAALESGHHDVVLVGTDKNDKRSKIIISLESVRQKSQELSNREKKSYLSQLIKRFRKFDKRAQKELMEMLNR